MASKKYKVIEDIIIKIPAGTVLEESGIKSSTFYQPTYRYLQDHGRNHTSEIIIHQDSLIDSDSLLHPHIQEIRE